MRCSSELRTFNLSFWGLKIFKMRVSLEMPKGSQLWLIFKLIFTEFSEEKKIWTKFNFFLFKITNRENNDQFYGLVSVNRGHLTSQIKQLLIKL